MGDSDLPLSVHSRDSAQIEDEMRVRVSAFADEFCAQLAGEIAAGDAEDLRKYLAGFIETRLIDFSEAEAARVAEALTKSAATRPDMGSPGKRTTPVDLKVDTFVHDVGVFATGAVGVTMMAFSSLFLGGLLALAAPALAVAFRRKRDLATKDRAAVQAPRAVREFCDQLAADLARRIHEFGAGRF